MNSLKELASATAKAYSLNARHKRAKQFRSLFDLHEGIRILDLGSENGSAIADVLAGTKVSPSNVYIADISQKKVAEGSHRFGFHPVLIPESGRLPFPSQFFDIVYCSSVIEHVTVPKEEVWSLRSGDVFKERALIRQKQFAEEVRRIGIQFFVQTPYRYFPLESHTWLPFAGWLPRPLLISLLHLSNRFWVKTTQPDWHLLNHADMTNLFPDSEILVERSFLLTKSLIAVRHKRGLASTFQSNAQR